MKSLISKTIVRSGVVAGAIAASVAALQARAQVSISNVNSGLPELARGEFGSVIISVIQWGLGIAGSVAVLYLIVGGFLYITAGGDEGKLEKAKGTIKNAIIGVVIILLALVIVTTINVAIVRNPGV